MTPQEKLIQFCKNKAKHLPEPWNEKYFTEEDLEEIKQWDNDTASKVWSILDKETNGHDYTLCCWCVLVGSDENDASWVPEEEDCKALCGYGKRHGICYHDDSDYQSLVTELMGMSISEFLLGSEVDLMEGIEEEEEQNG